MAPTRQTVDAVCNLQTFVRVACHARLEVTLKVRGAILVRVDELTVQGAELGRYNLDEVLEHVLRLRRLIPVGLSLEALKTNRDRRTLAVCPSSGFWYIPRRSRISLLTCALDSSASSSAVKYMWWIVCEKSWRLPSFFKYGTSS